MSQSHQPITFFTELKDTLTLGAPLVASQVIYALSSFIGTAMVARLGEDALAAGVLVNMVWFSLSVFFFNILSAGGILVAHRFGARQFDKISIIMSQAYLVCVFVIIAMLMALTSLPLFLHLSHQPPHIMQLSLVYMRSLRWTVPGLCYLILTEQFLAAVGHSRLIMRISFLVVPLEVVLMNILIFGKLGLPALGIAGIGYSFALSFTLVSIGLACFMQKSAHFKAYRLYIHFLKPQWHYVKEMLRIGVPMGLMSVVEVTAFAVGTFLIARFGTVILAAHQIVMQFFGLIITMIFAMAQAITVRVGHAVGREDRKGVRYAIASGFSLSSLITLTIAVLFYLMPAPFLRIDFDIDDPAKQALLHDATHLLRLSALLICFDNLRISAFGALRGLKDTRVPMWISVISFGVIAISSMWWLSIHFQVGGPGVWWGLIIGIISGAFLQMLRVHWLLPRVDLNKINEL